MKPALRVSAPALFTLLLCAAAALPFSGCATDADADRLRVEYYYRPGCSSCEQSTAKLASLEQDFPGQIKVETLDSTEPDAAKMVRMLEFRDHGLVIRSNRGAVLWKDGGHEVELDSVRQQVKDLLAFQQAGL